MKELPRRKPLCDQCMATVEELRAAVSQGLDIYNDQIAPEFSLRKNQYVVAMPALPEIGRAGRMPDVDASFFDQGHRVAGIGFIRGKTRDKEPQPFCRLLWTVLVHRDLPEGIDYMQEIGPMMECQGRAIGMVLQDQLDDVEIDVMHWETATQALVNEMSEHALRYLRAGDLSHLNTVDTLN